MAKPQDNRKVRIIRKKKSATIKRLEARLKEAEDTLQAIRSGQVDALIVAGPRGDRVYTLKGADQVYQLYLEAISEGAVTLSADGTILFANTRLATMLQCPLERVLGSRVQTFFSGVDQVIVEGLLGKGISGESRGEAVIRRPDETALPVYLACTRMEIEGLPALSLIVTDLSEQKRGQEILAAEQLARGILEQVAEAVVVCDLAGQVIRASRAAQSLLGENLLGQDFDATVALKMPRGSAEVRGLAARALSGQLVQGLEAARTRTSGELVELQATAAPLYDQKQQIIGCTISLTDVTARKQAEERVAVSNALLRAVLESTADAIYAKDLSGRYLISNAAAARLSGKPVAQIIGRPDAALLSPELAARFEHEDAAVLASGEPLVTEYDLEEDGELHTYHTVKTPFRNAAGEIIGVVGVGRDISALKEAERERTLLYEAEKEARQAAEEARGRLAFLAEASSLLSSSLDYRTTLENLAELAVRELADVCAVEVAREGKIELLAIKWRGELSAGLEDFRRRHPVDLQADFGVAKVLRTGLPVFLSHLRAEHLAAAVPDPDFANDVMRFGFRSLMLLPLTARGRTLGVVTFLSTTPGREYGAEDLELAEELVHRAALAVDNAQLYQDAQAAVRVRDQFFTIASHELKTPLTSMMGYAEMLFRLSADEPMDERRRRAVRTIFEQTARLNRMVTALLDVSRIEKGQLSLDLGAVDVCALAERLTHDAELGLARHSIELTGTGPLVVEGDELRLEQALQNLLQNAIKYSPRGGPVQVRCERRGDAAAVSVIDEGIGIPADDLPGLFGRFHRARNAEEWHIAGMGIGLYVVKEIIELHGGRVEVESQEGAGSRFTIVLPLMSVNK